MAKYDELVSVSIGAIINNRGESYLEYKKALTPRYIIVWRDIAMIYLFGMAFSYVLIFLQSNYPTLLLITIPLGALLLGYAMASLQLFFHEASHYTIASNRYLNDTLANLLIGCWIAQDIATYRKVHLEHHRYLGETNDPEHSYFDPLDWNYFFESLTGIKVFKVLLSRRQHISQRKETQSNHRPSAIAGKVLGLSLHVGIVIGSYITGNWQFALTWIIAIGSVFPLCSALRQLLEHRSNDAKAQVDYSQTAHGAVNRTFGDGIIASTFGAAGFNRHIFHHRDASVSYTRLKDVQEFLLDSPWGDEIRSAQTTYFSTFRELYSR